MKTPKSINVIGSVLTIVKTVNPENVKSGNVSFSDSEVKFIKENDFVTVKAADDEGNALGAWVGFGTDFQATLKPGYKKRSGKLTKVCSLLKYTKV